MNARTTGGSSLVVHMHLCGPGGDVRRQQLTYYLNGLKRDNAYVVNAMLNAGQHVPDTVIDLGLEYDPDGDAEPKEQSFFGMAEMVERGTFRCGDGSAYEAAVLEIKYGVPTQVLVVPQGSAEYHGIYVTPEGPIDPVEEWLRYWEAKQRGGRVIAPNPARGREPIEPAPMCRIDGGKVECTDVEDTSGCCIGKNGRWRCPGHHPLDGTKAKVERYKTREGKRWAVVRGVPVPVCPPAGRATR